MTAAAFCFDLGSPYAYLASERVDALMPVPPTWQPVLLGGIYKARDRSSWATTPRREQGMREVEQRAATYGLPPLTWPDAWPNDGLLAMRAATAARRSGFGERFAREAFRIHFVEGRPLSDPANVGRAAERCGRDARALLNAATGQDVKQELRSVTEAALEAGVAGVPSLVVGTGRPPFPVYWGDDRLEDAAAALVRRFADSWVAAWNAHDLDALIAHYEPDASLRSPRVRRPTGEPGGCLRGREALLEHFGAALAARLGLRVTLESVHRGVGDCALVYRSGATRVIKTMNLSRFGRIRSASVASETLDPVQPNP